MADYNSTYTGQQVDSAVRDVIDNRTAWSSKYTKPSTGIPEGDLSEVVRQKLNQGGGTAGVTSINGESGALSLRTVNGNALLGTGNIVISGGSIDIDDSLSSTSENPVQNKVIKAALDSKGTYSKPAGGIPASDLASDVILSINGKQDQLVSGTNIKTINGNDILGSGNIYISSGGTITVDSELSNTSENPVKNKVITNKINTKQDTLVSGTSIKTINNKTLLGPGNIDITAPDTSWEYITDAERLHFYNEIHSGDVYSVNGKTGDVRLTTDDIGIWVDDKLSDTSRQPVQNKVVKAAIDGKQDQLVSGINIRTINGNSLLAQGDLTIGGGGSVLVVNFAESSTRKRQYSNAAITENHELIYYEFGTPSNVTGETTVVIDNGRITVTAGLSGATSIKLILAEANTLN